MSAFEASHLFAGAAPYYRRYRPPYPAALFDHLCAYFALARGASVIDAGAGTGHIAIPLAARGMTVTAIDPNRAMLDEGRAEAAHAGVEGIRWVEGVAERLGEFASGPVDLVTFGASLHWIDPEPALAACDRLVRAGGGVAVISRGPSIWDDSLPEWAKIVRRTHQDFLGEQRRAGAGVYQAPPLRYEEVLAASAFSRFESARFDTQLVWSIDDLIGMQYSTSYGAAVLASGRKEEFERALRERLRAHAPNGRLPERFEVEAFCAKRP